MCPTGDSIEIGVFYATYSMQLMHGWPGGGRHFLVDPYRHFKCTGGRDKQCTYGQPTWDVIHEHTWLRVNHSFPLRGGLIRAYSEEAAQRFPQRAFDFAYVDGRHDYEGVLIDLRAWWDRLCPGGLLAGHDYAMAGVARALRRFMREKNISSSSLYVTREHPPSWFFFRAPDARCAAADAPAAAGAALTGAGKPPAGRSRRFASVGSPGAPRATWANLELSGLPGPSPSPKECGNPLKLFLPRCASLTGAACSTCTAAGYAKGAYRAMLMKKAVP